MTGGSRGIGLACATHLARSGFDVAINGMRDASAVAEPIVGIESQGAQVIYCQGDIGSADAR